MILYELPLESHGAAPQRPGTPVSNITRPKIGRRSKLVLDDVGHDRHTNDHSLVSGTIMLGQR
jgi:hypothetical protein